MYDMTRVNANGYFDAEDSEEARHAKREALCAQRLADLQAGAYALGGGVVDPLPEDAPQFVKDYYDYYKTPRGYHERSGNSTDGWNVTSNTSWLNTNLLQYAHEIENAVLVVHGENAHSLYMGEDAYKLLRGENKKLLVVPGASHCDLYDGGGKNAIPFEAIEAFFDTYLV
jgi:fermentation-respiration switch protein FrsA (DUF1100 family)